MKVKILIYISLALASSVSHAGKIGIDVGAGLRSNYGLLGLGLRYFPNKHFDLFINGGADIGGAVTVIGARVFTPPMGKTCFFIIPCVPLYYLGVHAGQSHGGDITYKDSGQEGEYTFSSGRFSGVNLGILDLYGGWFYYSLDIGYRSYQDKPVYELKSGSPNLKTEEDFDEYLEPGLTYGFNIGILF